MLANAIETIFHPENGSLPNFFRKNFIFRFNVDQRIELGRNDQTCMKTLKGFLDLNWHKFTLLDIEY